MEQFRVQLETALGNAYQLERELGGGGMSRVFLATETALSRKVVIKVLPPELLGGANVERFRREIQFAAKLRHPHIVPLLNAGDANGLLYYTMPYVVGQTLRARVADGSDIPLPEIVQVLKQVASALSHAHDESVVHRDLKPENILLEYGHAVVTDFGIAKAIATATASHGFGSLTRTGLSIGTPGYMAPEQAAGESEIDHRADLYSLGVIAYEMLAGEPPFRRQSAQGLIAAHMIEVPEPVSNRRKRVPAVLADLVMRLLAKQASERPASAREVIQILESLDTRVVRRPSSRTRERRIALVSGATLATIVIIGTALAIQRHGEPSKREVEPVIVVLPFENQTGDTVFAPLGIMAADWVTQGLSSTGLLQVVDSRTANSSARQTEASRGGGDPSLRDLVARTGATVVVSGRYYRDRDSLRFQSQVLDANNGRLLRVVEPVSTDAAHPMSALEMLRQRIMGAVATVHDVRVAGVSAAGAQPPRYDAYLEFVQGINAEMTDGDSEVAAAHYLRAAALDTSFAQALLWAMWTLQASGRMQRADSVGRAVARVQGRLSPYDRSSFAFNQAWIRADLEETLRAAREMVRLSPKSQDALWSLQIALLSLNRPAEAARVWQRIGDDRGIYSDNGDGFAQHSLALHLAGDFGAALRVAQTERERYPADARPLNDEVAALAGLGRAEDVMARLDTMLTLVPESRRWNNGLLRLVPLELRAHGLDSASRRAFARLLHEREAWRATDTSLGVRANDRALYYLAGAWEKARPIAERLATEHPDSVLAQGYVGALAAHRGDRAEAERVSKRLAGMSQPFSPGPGNATYWRARIAAVLGDKERAVDLLREALRQGFSYDISLGLHYRVDFDSLRGHLAFESLLAPKG